jgi:tRNA threonylcarbamoyladenosine biosynthesis protein TsaE
MPEVIVNSLSELPTAAVQIIEAIGDRNVLAFYGEMGAGKTTFIKAVCVALGVKETISSPTFSIVNEYLSASGRKIYHFDFYRIKDINEAFDMGYEEYLYSDALCLIEWPEKIEAILPENVFSISIASDTHKRMITF